MHCLYEKNWDISERISEKPENMFKIRCGGMGGGGGETEMGPGRMRHSSHDFGSQSGHSVDLPCWQAKMASIEIWIP